MIYEYCTDEDYLGEYISVVYEITSPVKLRMRKPDGTEDLIGYGIGERIEVLERDCCCMVVHEPKLRSEIQMVNGNNIFDFPEKNFCKRIQYR